MRGNEKVIGVLNEALKNGLTAIVQYIVHAEMCQNWGYTRIGSFVKKQAIDEMKHAEGLIERILSLGGTPRVDVMATPKIGDNVKAQLENDLSAELEAVRQYNSAVAVCTGAGDNTSRAMFEKMVRDEEVHADFLEAQLFIIGEIGYDNYLARQIQGE